MPLFVVSTPIGNADDITVRAIAVLKHADLIACEDTRKSGLLLHRLGIDRPLTSYFEHNEGEKARRLLAELRAGRNVAVISNAGTPGLSDPGYRIIRLAIDNDIPVVPVPGPTAFVAAAVASGFPVHELHFFGFPPRKAGPRRRMIEGARELGGTLAFYEAPHRIRALLDDALDVLGDRDAAAARELTKKFEEFVRLPLSKLREHFAAAEPRGEFVLLIEGQNRARNRE